MKNDSDSIEGFIAAARRYCEWAESELKSPQAAVKHSRELLLELYLKALHLPNISSEEVEIPQLDESEIIPVYQRLAKLPVGYYWECFNPFVTPAEEPVAAMIGDDLGDIYRDLKYGFRCHEAGHRDEAVWQWRFSFHSHWGRHVVGALRALHCYAEENFFGE